ncbi:PEP-CTERM motif protein [Maioricimonas rarisocia]|uniref:PEP-CTERM motif protein n=1 Tax=Maioricimonas rarisocia TaxID=2528026 RepID=A0A517ZAZ3_9PLAN|nr:PEP-CTERM sorting domain-containing protein [Maioricimonas rarisocia]QDU39627.1 PEP-CTERM motif protein [Maioricimonas rarisocia]
MTQPARDLHDNDLNREIEAYSASAQDQLSRSDKAGGAVDAIKFGVAGSVALLIGSQLEATVQYRPNLNLTVTKGSTNQFNSSSLFLDIDLDGTNDFLVNLHATQRSSVFTSTNTLGPNTATIGTSNSTTAGIDLIALVVGNAFSSSNGISSAPRRFSSGATIGPLANPNSGIFMTHKYVSNGQSTTLPGGATSNFGGTSTFSSAFGTSTGIAGLQFQRAGNTHFAWIRLDVDRDPNGYPHTLTIVDLAWESFANTPIIAGATAGTVVPEPSSAALMGLGMLAMGATGLRQRRRKKAEEQSEPATTA